MNRYKNGQGITDHWNKIADEIRKSETIQARLTKEEKQKFDKDRGDLTESAYIRLLINNK